MDDAKQVRMVNAEGRTLILEGWQDTLTVRFFDRAGEPTGQSRPWPRTDWSLNALVERYEHLGWWVSDPGWY